MTKRTLTDQDLIENPELVEKGLKAGDEIEIPEPEEIDEENGKKADTDAASIDPAGDGDTGGGAPPADKPRG